MAAGRVARRAPGTGTHVLLDRLLLDAGLDPDALRGPEVGSHLEVALAVAGRDRQRRTGRALRGRRAGREPALRADHVGEYYDLVLTEAALDAAARSSPRCAARRCGAPSRHSGRGTRHGQVRRGGRTWTGKRPTSTTGLDRDGLAGRCREVGRRRGRACGHDCELLACVAAGEFESFSRRRWRSTYAVVECRPTLVFNAV